ncbi:MAG: hypothetical protein K0S76_2095 [Herbinix sp.]|jgi:hypothetical protein|nr:hypothetical protein [Herbinix sp.]
MNQIYRIYHPEIFQGANKRKNYFEGWYYKLIDKSKEHAFAIIPGISIKERDVHAFVQVLDQENNTYYFRYPISDFCYHPKKFEISIGDNVFSQNRLLLNIRKDGINICGTLHFKNIVTLPKTILRPGIMGPYSYVPFMECYHGIVSIHHDIFGQLKVLGKTLDYNAGYGYIEKDWGRSFPEHWIWFQSNHFDNNDITLMFSVAKIPWINRAFTGFLSIFRYQDQVYVFATYTGAKLKRLEVSNGYVRVRIEDFRFRLDMKVLQTEGGAIKAPTNDGMERNIIESINAVVKVRLTDRSGDLIYEGRGTNTGLEIVNPVGTDCCDYTTGKK